MVRTDDDLDNMPPEKRIALLNERRKKRIEELEKQKKEIEELEEKEQVEAQAALERTIEELLLEEEEHFVEEEKKRLEKLQQPLEETVAEEEAPVPEGALTYESPLERFGAPESLYDLSDYNLYDELRRIEEKGYMTASEQQFVVQVQERATSIRASYSRQDLLSKDPGHYVQRTESIMKRLTDNLYKGEGSKDMHAVYK